MAAFTTTMTLLTDLSDSVITLWDEAVILTYTPELVADQAATIRKVINAKTIQFTIFSNLAIPSALVDGEDPASVALVDTPVTLTPVEEGAVVTKTLIDRFQTGGKVDTAAAQLVGRNMGVTQDYRAIAAIEAFTTEIIYPNSATAASNLATTDVLDYKFANRMYSRLARKNVPGIGQSYLGIAHEDCLFDLRDSLTPVRQYQDLTSILNNEMGFAAGTRWLRSSNVTVTADSSGTIDSYKVNILGANALGKAVSNDAHPVLSGPFDKLGRFLNVGWYGVFKYGLVDTHNQIQGICASSVGSN